jgi:hypothetical protein
VVRQRSAKPKNTGYNLPSNLFPLNILPAIFLQV